MTLPTFEIWFVRFALFFLMGNPINVLFYGGSGDQIVENVEGSFLEPIISMVLYGIAFIFVLMRWKKVLYEGSKANFSILLFVGCILASTVWSDYPDITLRRSLIVLGATVFGAYFGTSFTFQQQLEHLAWALTGIVLLCLGFGVLLPKYGQMHVYPHNGAWRGIYMHKQGLGTQMTLTLAFFLTMFKNRIYSRNPKLFLFTLSCAAFMLFTSRSSTGLIVTLILVIALWICNLLRSQFEIMVPTLIGMITLFATLFVYAVDHVDAVTALVGKDVTFSGRMPLWAALWEMISRRPWLGYGYEGFWQGRYSESSLVWQVVGWSAPHAHNGILELLLGIGWVGTTCFLISLGVNLFRIFQLVRLNASVETLYPLLFLLYFILTNMTERNIIGGGPTWLLYVWLCFLPCKPFQYGIHRSSSAKQLAQA
jgi:exopolysaccharide production protein ExoQ